MWQANAVYYIEKPCIVHVKTFCDYAYYCTYSRNKPTQDWQVEHGFFSCIMNSPSTLESKDRQDIIVVRKYAMGNAHVWHLTAVASKIQVDGVMMGQAISIT